jgi:iron complex outermembrane receptor protein
LLGGEQFPDLGTVTVPRLSLSYAPTNKLYAYLSYAEGFETGDIVNDPNVPEPIVLDPETVKTREVGLRSEWFAGRLRFNATYFESPWAGLRVPRRLEDTSAGGAIPFVSVPSSDGVAQTTGLELELLYVPNERWQLDLAIGMLDSEYLDVGDPPADGRGLQPGSRLAFAPEASYSVSASYRLPIGNGGTVTFAGNYGWMDEYERAVESDLQSRTRDGSPRPEPSYGILNTRIVYTPSDASWSLSLFGTNLTDEWYVNGGTNPGVYIGYDIATIGRRREVGLGFTFEMD